MIAAALTFTVFFALTVLTFFVRDTFLLIVLDSDRFDNIKWIGGDNLSRAAPDDSAFRGFPRTLGIHPRVHRCHYRHLDFHHLRHSGKSSSLTNIR